MLKLTEYFLKHPRVTNMIVFLIFVMGILSALTLQREQSPTVSFDVIKITTIYPGAAPEDVEINVTNKIEDQLMDVENIKKLNSMSMENVSIIYAIIDSDAGDPGTIKSDIRDAVFRVSDLPKSVTQKPVIDEMKASNLPVLEVALTGKVSEHELRKYAKELEARFKEIPGVSRITKTGYRKREVRINVDMKKIKKYSISLTEIMNAVKSRNVRDTGGTVESYVSEKKIMTISEYDKPMDVKDVIVRANYEGYSVRISDIAVVTNDFEDAQVLYKGNAKPSIALIINKQDSADIINLSDNLNKELNKFRKTLPENVEAQEIFDFAIYPKIMLNITATNFLFGFVLVLFVMFIFLDRKSAFWAAFGIPFSIFGGIILFAPLGINFNTVTLATLILLLGIIVDDAIVVTERIFSNKQDGMNSYDATVAGVRKMILPVSAAVITTILAFFPITFVPGIMGKFLKDIPVIILVVLAFSLIEAIFFIPAHVLHADPPSEPPKRIRWLKYVVEWYNGVLLLAFRNRKKVIAGFIGVFLLVITASGFFMKMMLNQDVDQDVFFVVVEAPQGTSLKRTYNMVSDVEKLIYKHVPKNVMKSMVTNIGHHDMNLFGATSGQYSNWGMVVIYLIPAARRDITTESIIEDMKPKIKKLKAEKGFHRLSVEPIVGIPVGKAVNIIYISNDDRVREKFEKETLEFLWTVDGVSSIETSNVPGKEEMQLKLNYKMLARVGLTAVDVARSVRTAFDGTVVTSIRRQGEDIDYRVIMKDPKRFRAKGILELPVANREGRLIPIKYFGKFVNKTGPSVIHHYRGKRSVTITADVDEKKITSVEINKLIRKKFEKKATGIPGFRMKFGGQEEEMQESMEGFYFAFFVVIISIYFILVVLFNSFLQPVLIMSVIPFAVMSVFLTLMLHNLPLTFVSLLGMLGLIGVVVNDTIVMVRHLNEECRAHGTGFEVIANGAVHRFRPVILTTLTTFAGLLPTSYGIGGDIPDIRPMVLTMAWGLVFSTAVTLIFLPMLFSYIKVKPKKS
ncbi:efflux RND transporter permease subunit [Spirochaetota bacterium]